MTTKYVLSIGLFDKDTHELEISVDAAQKLVNSEVASRFDGATVYSADGVYRHNDGSTVREPTIRVELLYTDRAKVVDFARWAKKILNQESVLLEQIQEDADFI